MHSLISHLFLFFRHLCCLKALRVWQSSLGVFLCEMDQITRSILRSSVRVPFSSCHNYPIPMFRLYALALFTSSFNPTYAIDDYSKANSTERIIGWVPSPDGRGTYDILQACLFTIFLCTWSALHLNIPAPAESRFRFVLRKAKWMLSTLLGPEFIVFFAVSHRLDASRSVQSFRELGYPQWTLRHAFYVNMGGMLICTPDFPPFPATWRQVGYLLSQKLMTLPEISAEELWDKSKADLLTKFLVCAQTLWMVVQIIARAVQGLPIATLELLTLSYVLCACATYALWLNKPLDIATPTRIRLDTGMREILVRAGEAAAKPYRQNPLDFVDDQIHTTSVQFEDFLGFRLSPRQRPLPCLSNARFHRFGYGFVTMSYLFFLICFMGTHLAGWNLEAFPSAIEQLLWRVASGVICGCILMTFALEVIRDRKSFQPLRLTRYIRDRRSSTIEKPGQESSEWTVTTLPYWQQLSDPKGTVSIWYLLSYAILALLYGLARLYVIAEVFAGLRNLPRGVFATIEWTKFIHLI